MTVEVGDRIRDFELLNVAAGPDPFSVFDVPEPEERVDAWQDSYEPSYPLLADSEAEIGSAYDQPARFGVLGRFSDFLGRMPAVVIVDRRGEVSEVAYVYRGTSTFDRPEIDDLLGELDELRPS